MQTIDVRMHLDASPEKVWEILADHEGYASFKEVSKAQLLQAGTTERNGAGAVRELILMGATFVEDIVTFDPPRRLEYKVKRSTTPIRHELGRIDLTPGGGGTDLHWVSRFEVPIPVLGRLLEPVMRLAMSRVFTSVLLQLGTRLGSERVEAPDQGPAKALNG